jgi:hypothetical protein
MSKKNNITLLSEDDVVNIALKLLREFRAESKRIEVYRWVGQFLAQKVEILERDLKIKTACFNRLQEEHDQLIERHIASRKRKIKTGHGKKK